MRNLDAPLQRATDVSQMFASPGATDYDSLVAKARTQFLCNSCGSVHPKWMGKCPDCGTWDSLQEYKTPAEDVRKKGATATGDLTQGAQAMALGEIDEALVPRRRTGIGEFDRILGGGIV